MLDQLMLHINQDDAVLIQHSHQSYLILGIVACLVWVEKET